MFNDTLKKIADAVVEANRIGDVEPLLNERYAPDCVSVEAAQMGEMPRAAEGLDAIRAKHAWWNANMDMHGGTVEGPYLFEPDRFAVRFTMDITDKTSGERSQAAEIGVYSIKDGKIVREEFFYEA